MRAKIFRPVAAGLLFCFLGTAFALADSNTSETDYLPTERYYSELLKSSPELQAYDAELNKAWKAFYASFSPAGSPSSKRLALEWYRKCRIEGQKLLERYIGDKEAFISHQLRQTQLIEYMRRVSALAKAPDADLQFMLSGMNCYRGKRSADSNCYPGSVLGQLALAAVPDLTEEKKWKILEQPEIDYYEEQELKFKYFGKSSLNIEYVFDLNAHSDATYTMSEGPGGVFYGHGSSFAWTRHSSYKGIYGDFTMVKDGLIHFLYPESLPSPDEVFPAVKDGRISIDSSMDTWLVYPDYKMPAEGEKGEEELEYLAGCEMALRYLPLAENDFSAIMAESYQINPNHYTSAWQCVPQCRIPYKLEGNVYKKQPPVCLPDAEWGVRPPEH